MKPTYEELMAENLVMREALKPFVDEIAELEARHVMPSSIKRYYDARTALSSPTSKRFEKMQIALKYSKEYFLTGQNKKELADALADLGDEV